MDDAALFLDPDDIDNYPADEVEKVFG